ncbi:hypothetical protein CB1_000394038 [Camelus ferus]|nr:hypothetical protein CB1_000394038 [Camelus ferus]
MQARNSKVTALVKPKGRTETQISSRAAHFTGKNPQQEPQVLGQRRRPQPGQLAGALSSDVPHVHSIQLTDDLSEPVIVRINAHIVQGLLDVLGASAGWLWRLVLEMQIPDNQQPLGKKVFGLKKNSFSLDSGLVKQIHPSSFSGPTGPPNSTLTHTSLPEVSTAACALVATCHPVSSLQEKQP